MAYGARLESVLGESPRGFESPILRRYTLSKHRSYLEQPRNRLGLLPNIGHNNLYGPSEGPDGTLAFPRFSCGESWELKRRVFPSFPDSEEQLPQKYLAGWDRTRRVTALQTVLQEIQQRCREPEHPHLASPRLPERDC